MTRAHTRNNSERTQLVINRTAMDSSGTYGSLYDARIDRIFGFNIIETKLKIYERFGRRTCIITSDKESQCLNVLKHFGIQDEIRLSALLDRDRNGIMAFLDYPRKLKENNRVLYYLYEDHEERVDEITENKTISRPMKMLSDVTHIITGFRTGLHVIAVLELPDDPNRINRIDEVLHRIRNSLKEDDDLRTLNYDEIELLKTVRKTTIYSNILCLERLKYITDVYNYLASETRKSINVPISYILRPIQWLFPYFTGPNTTFNYLPAELSNYFEEYLFLVKCHLDEFDFTINHQVLKSFSGYLRDQVYNLKRQQLGLKDYYEKETERIRRCVINIRSGKISIPNSNEILQSVEQKRLSELMGQFRRQLDELLEKGKLIQELEKRNFKYYNVKDFNIDHPDRMIDVERLLVQNYEQDCILCSNDTLNEYEPKLKQEFIDFMESERRENPGIRLIYADFSYNNFEMQDMQLLPFDKYKGTEQRLKGKCERHLKANPVRNEPKSTKTSPLTDLNSFLTISTTFGHGFAKNDTLLTQQSKTLNHFGTHIPTHTPSLVQPKIQNSHLQIQKPPYKKISTYGKSPASQRDDIRPAILANTDKPDTLRTGTHRSSFTTVKGKSSDQIRLLKTNNSSRIEPNNDIVASQTPYHAKNEKRYEDKSHDQTINILLLGETGVGKSTFINAFVNYLEFDSLERAEHGRPIVLIPVSFVLSVGHDFEEKQIEFGNLRDLNNEDFHHPGQSVTQRCQSYVFYPPQMNGSRIRIIDTPGFGDTRGLDQDDINMDHILEYINNLTHLDAICFLLKPNSTRLNISFQSCFNQLFSLLNPDARDNIIFCFTNSRSTFYTPGDTASLLRRMLGSLPIGNVPFNKENTFCLDSESFRYLVALQNGITFDEKDKQDYENSWKTSAKESNRLIDFIFKTLRTYVMKENNKSTKQLQLLIAAMVTPILETIRNILRNYTLLRRKQTNSSIDISAKTLDIPTIICRQCNDKVINVGGFSIIVDQPHTLRKNCNDCDCSAGEHSYVNYALEYKFLEKPGIYNENQMVESIDILIERCVYFSHFLSTTPRYSKFDPFLSEFTRMISQEEKICENERTNQLNATLLNELRKALTDYEQMIKRVRSEKKDFRIEEIKRLIDSVNKIPLIKVQMTAIEEGWKRNMDKAERKVQTQFKFNQYRSSKEKSSLLNPLK